MRRNKKSSVFHDLYNQPYNINTRIKLYNSTKCKLTNLNLQITPHILCWNKLYFFNAIFVYLLLASLQMIQRMALLKRLEVHRGCVNSICWNNTGDMILSGSDDQHLVLTNAHNYQVTIITNNLYFLILF